MQGPDLEAELKFIRDRLVRLEREVFGADPTAAATRSPPPSPPAPPLGAAAAQLGPKPAARPATAAQGSPTGSLPHPAYSARSTPAISILGLGGAAAFVMAAAYLVRLAIDAGVLTPTVQVSLAVLFGVLLIAVGVALRRVERGYAALLPAAGVAVLYAALFGAHLFYQLIGQQAAMGAVVAIGAAALWLCVLFDSDGYALFAIAGSYAAPLLMHGRTSGLDTLAVYFSAWSVTFSAFAVARHRRLIYLVALYVALFCFDALAQPRPQDWSSLVWFQAVQFVIFGVGALVYTLRHRQPLDEEGALMHLPALLLFYAFEYFTLKAHLPALAPGIAALSLVVLLALCLVARVWLPKLESPGARFLLLAYAALVIFHAGYLESVPAAWAPWVAAGAFVLAAATFRRWVDLGLGAWAIGMAAGAMFGLNLLRVLLNANQADVAAWPLVGVVYAGLLYAGFALVRAWPAQSAVAQTLLYAAHLTAMAVAVHLLQDPILQSVSWGLVALTTLALALVLRDAVLAQSSLVVFGATAVKVMLMDLQGSAPVARIVSLFALGVMFYAGGMLYRRVVARTQS